MPKNRLVLTTTFLFVLAIACNFTGSDETASPTTPPANVPTQMTDPTTIPLPTEAISPPTAHVYIGPNGNVWFRPDLDAPAQQITSDANPIGPGSQPSAAVSYLSPVISDDAQWLAYRRDHGIEIEAGYEFTYGLWIHNLSTGESQEMFNGFPAGFDWKPGTHLLTYGIGVPEAYFLDRGGLPDPELAFGMWTFNADTGERSELVKPERGYALYNPQWSPDGRFLGFDEIAYMEGRGPFAYYDFDTETYISWENPIGNYDWSPDGSQIYYDQMVYVPSGTEDIFSREFPEGSEGRLTEYVSETEYTFLPTVSPSGDRLAFLANLGGPDNQTYELMVLDLGDGGARSLGTFEKVYILDWSPDGEWLLFSAGPWEEQELLAVNAADGAVWNSGPGTSPSVAGGLF